MREREPASFQRFTRGFAVLAVIASLLPWAIGMIARPGDGMYLGFQFNTDDHMVYSAWIHQAMEGHLFFRNLFTTDPQPGLTIHVYFLALGLVAKGLGIFTTVILARILFAYLFIASIGGLIRRVGLEIFAAKIALVLATFGAGIGYTVWHSFGLLIARDIPAPIATLLGGRLPIDVWQPEAFVFPSMLTNGLFLVSGWLMITILNCVLDARESRKAVVPGLIAFAVLMNIHSYDVLLLGLVLVSFAVSSWRFKHLAGLWMGRVSAMVLGVTPAATWFVYVLSMDKVFQARADTPTFSPPFASVLLGVLPIAIGAAAMMKRSWTKKSAIVFCVATALIVVVASQVTVAWPNNSQSVATWVAMYVVAVAGSAALATESVAKNLLINWALVGLTAPYFPGLFQRKLTMMLAIPIGILAAIGLSQAVAAGEKSKKNFAAAATIILCCASSLQWFTRELTFVRTNVANTTRHPVFLTENVTRIVRALEKIPNPKIVLAVPGASNPVPNVPDAFSSPILPDLAPILTGLTGATSYAGHWSETPRYAARAKEATALFLTTMSDTERIKRLESIGVDLVVAPVGESYPGVPFYDFRALGEVIVDGPQFRLIRLRRELR